MPELIFLKLGGSLITDKTKPFTPRLDKLNDLAGQIADVLKQNSELRILLGHGSGSFGHVAAREYGTRAGVRDEAGWRGFAEVRHQAAALNRHVMDALHNASISALSFPPSSSVSARDGQVSAWDLRPLRKAFEHRLLPVVYGDVVFDELRGGTILSTEELFGHLARELRPTRILLAGLEEGVWEDFPGRTRLLNEINSKSFEKMRADVKGASAVDVTGGMESKVEEMLSLANQVHGLEALIFSGEESGNVTRALQGGEIGTRIRV